MGWRGGSPWAFDVLAFLQGQAGCDAMQSALQHISSVPRALCVANQIWIYIQFEQEVMALLFPVRCDSPGLWARWYWPFSSNCLLDFKPDKAWLNKTLPDCYLLCVILFFLAYFTLQVIYARRKFKISPPETAGHPEFERIFRAQ